MKIDQKFKVENRAVNDLLQCESLLPTGKKVLTKRESPDFLLMCGEVSIGVEVISMPNFAFLYNEEKDETVQIYLKIKKSIEKKIKKLASYDKFSQNWLLIYTEHEVLEEEKIVPMIMTFLSRSEAEYDAILVKLEGSIYKFYEGKSEKCSLKAR